jgi:hypothetical protein
MSMLNLGEIVPGLVAYLNHDDLEQRGIIGSQYRNRSGHWFLCLECSDGSGVWVLLTSCPGYAKVRIPAAGKIGHPGWAASDSYAAGQSFMFEASNWDVQVASRHDRSAPGHRNFIDDAWLEEVRRQCRLGSHR